MRPVKSCLHQTAMQREPNARFADPLAAGADETTSRLTLCKRVAIGGALRAAVRWAAGRDDTQPARQRTRGFGAPCCRRAAHVAQRRFDVVREVPETEATLRQKRIPDRCRLGAEVWWPRAESNHRHADFQSAALPTELLGRFAREDQHGSIAARPYSPPPRLLRVRSTPSCLSLRYRCVRSRPVFSATRVIEPCSLARWNSK